MSNRVTYINSLNIDLARQVEQEIADLSAGFNADIDADNERKQSIATRKAEQKRTVRRSKWLRFFGKGA